MPNNRPIAQGNAVMSALFWTPTGHQTSAVASTARKRKIPPPQDSRLAKGN
jgi:hypothetical protein